MFNWVVKLVRWCYVLNKRLAVTRCTRTRRRWQCNNIVGSELKNVICLEWREETNPKAVSYIQVETNKNNHNMGELIVILIVFYSAGCPGGNVPDVGRIFFKLKYTDITQSTYTRCWTVTEIMAREVTKYDSCYTLIDYQIHIKTGRNMWFL
jgi:hypothetical protein